MIEKENLLDRAQQLGQIFRRRLDELKEQCEIVREVRALGLMIGVELTVEGGPVVQACMERKLLVNCTQGTVIRLLPAMTLTDEQAHQGCDILAQVLKSQVAQSPVER